MFGKFSREKIKLHIFLTIALGIPALLWAIQSIRAAIGMMKLAAHRAIRAAGKIKMPARIDYVCRAR